MNSASAQDYLKAVLFLASEDNAASTSKIAEQLGVAAASVTGMLKRLAERGLVEHVPYYGARLTEDGRAEAVRLVRRHRLIELFLVRMLGYEWDRVHEEAERMEHAVSDELVERIAVVLGQPVSDPHGAPIPERDRPFREPSLPTLAELAVGGRARLREVPDRDPEVLRYLAKLNFFPGNELVLIARAPSRGPLRVEIEGEEQHIGMELSEQIRVEPLGRSRRGTRRVGGRRTRGTAQETGGRDE
jgi:DtxR family transcriptional regulator, Mn-dependent transcriptional regulator